MIKALGNAGGMDEEALAVRPMQRTFMCKKIVEKIPG